MKTSNKTRKLYVNSIRKSKEGTYHFIKCGNVELMRSKMVMERYCDDLLNFRDEREADLTVQGRARMRSETSREVVYITDEGLNALEDMRCRNSVRINGIAVDYHLKEGGIAVNGLR